MQVSVETLEGLNRRMVITVPSEQVEKLTNEKLKKEAKRARVDGFRPGKVPASVIKKRYGQALENEASDEIMQRNFFEAIMNEKLNPAGMPEFSKQKSDDKEFQFEATFEVYPEVEFKDFADLSIETVDAKVTDIDVDDMLETLRKQHATTKSVKRKSKKEDKVKIDFVGKIDGEEFEGGKSEGFELELGSNQMIPGFEKSIIGQKAGTEFDINVTFPEDYHAENLKGKEAVFSINLHEVNQPVLPELDDEFATKLGVKEGGIEKLRTEIKSNMTREMEQTQKSKYKETVMDSLLNSNPIDVPQSLIASEVKLLKEQAIQRFGQQNNAIELPDDLFSEQAKRRVQIGLLLGELIKHYDINVDDADAEKLIADMSQSYEKPEELVSYYKKNPEMMKQIKNMALEEKAIDFIAQKATVTKKDVSFSELMGKS